MNSENAALTLLSFVAPSEHQPLTIHTAPFVQSRHLPYGDAAPVPQDPAKQPRKVTVKYLHLLLEVPFSVHFIINQDLSQRACVFQLRTISIRKHG